MDGYIKLKVNSIMGEEISKTIDTLIDIHNHYPLKEDEIKCLDMAIFHLGRVRREMLFHTIPEEGESDG